MDHMYIYIYIVQNMKNTFLGPGPNIMEKVLRESLAGVRTELSELHENLDRTAQDRAPQRDPKEG